MVEVITAEQVKASDVLVFSETEYKVRSVIVKSDHVEIGYWGANDMYPYFYERSDQVERKVS